MATETATMSLPLDLIKPAIEAKINTAVVEALGQQDLFIMKVVEQVMSQRVDENGKINDYNGYNKTPWLTWAVMDITRSAIKKAINDHIGSNAEKIKAAIDAEMRKSKSPLVQSLVTAMAEGLAKAAASEYGMTVTFGPK